MVYFNLKKKQNEIFFIFDFIFSSGGTTSLFPAANTSTTTAGSSFGFAVTKPTTAGTFSFAPTTATSTSSSFNLFPTTTTTARKI